MSDPLPAEKPLSPAAPWWVLPSLEAAVLAIFLTALFLSFVWGNETQQTTMLTASVGLAIAVSGYVWGSSDGGRKNQEAMARISVDAATNGRQS